MNTIAVLESAVETAKQFVRPYYFRYLSRRADWNHISPSNRIEPNGAPDHVLVLVLDALRPDRVPELPLSYSRAISPSTWTFPAVTSLHTGQYPHEHGAIARTASEDETFAMPEQASPEPTLPKIFESAGYDTLGVFGFPMAFMATRSWYGTHRVFADAPADRVIDVYKRWLKNRNRTFAYLHLGDLHAPLKPPERYVKAHGVDMSLEQLPLISKYTDSYDDSDECQYYREHRLRLYDAALDYVEDAIRPVIQELLDKDIIILLTGDHGEAHWEHASIDRQMTDSRPNYGVGHGGTPFDMVSRVPVGVSTDILLPEGGWASLRDIPTTLTGYAFDIEEIFDGYDWQTTIPTDRIVFSEAPRYGVERKAAYSGRDKVIQSTADDVTLCALIEEDSGERFIERKDSIHGRLLGTLPDAWGDGYDSTTVNHMVSDQLEALGYK